MLSRSKVLENVNSSAASSEPVSELATSPDDNRDIAELRRQMAILRMENELLRYQQESRPPSYRSQPL